MEYALEAQKRKGNYRDSFVLILVLMEYALEGKSFARQARNG